MELNQRLIELGACEEARKWAKGKTARQAWEQCERGDWLLWWATKEKENTDFRQLTLAKARVAKLVLHLMKDERSIAAVEAAEKYGMGLIGVEELNAAAAAAGAAAGAAAAAAFRAAADAFHAAAADVLHAAAAACAGAAAACAGAADDAAAICADACHAGAASSAACADIVRQTITPDFL